MILKGNPVSEGIAIGTAYLFKATDYSPAESYIEEDKIADAADIFQNALSKAKEELNKLIADFPGGEDEQSKIFAAHREMLSDEEMIGAVTDAINNSHMAPDYAVYTVFSEFISLISKSQNELIGARAADLLDVRNRLIRIIRGEKESNLSRLPENTIVIAQDLKPSDTATIDRNHISGIITERGSSTSHSAIIARSFCIPAVLGVPAACSQIVTGDIIIVDAIKGEVLITTDETVIAAYKKKRDEWLKERASTEAYLDKEPFTKDGVRIDLGINIGSDNQGDEFAYADFCGLFRTEFLYMQSDHLPTEEEQFIAYKRVLEQAKGKPATLRTLDIGGDKTLPYMQLPKEDNPFLGKRAIRLCFDETVIFKTQLRAALRASVFGKLQIMFPMVSHMDDLRRAKAVAEEVKSELKEEGIPFDEAAPLGVMIEVPSAAIIADHIAGEVDFASIGTNDLCQYLCAADRMNPEVTAYYQSFSPAMIRAIEMIACAFIKTGKPLSVCGEMAGDPWAVALLIGLGIRKLSMNSSNIAAVKKALPSISLTYAERIVDLVRNCMTESEVLAVLKSKKKFN